MTEEYVNYQQARLLKERGFDYQCRHYYTKEDAADDEVWLATSGAANWNADDGSPFDKPLCSAPTQALAQKWMREQHLFFIYVRPCIWHKRNIVFDLHWIWCSDDGLKDGRIDNFPTYESALSAGIDAALELIRK